MNSTITTKLAALAVAMMMNSLIIGAVAYLFNSQSQPHAVLTSLAHAAKASALHGAI